MAHLLNYQTAWGTAKRSAIVLIAIVVAALVGNQFVAGQSSAADRLAKQPESLPAGPVAKMVYSGPYIGVSSCSASACHGGRIPSDPMQLWRASYTIWASQEPLNRNGSSQEKSASPAPPMLDKHNRAYAVLFDDRSRQIEKLLRRLPAGEEPRAYADDRCLACHAASSESKATPTSPIPAGILADGVGCELCHGAAQKWVSRHTEIDWLADYHAGKFAPLSDMNDTRNPVTRARVCAGCHVGSPATASHRQRDVDHDLIAAGHPRLSFELDAYLSCMPKHWIDEPGRKRGFLADREIHAETWLLGQLVVAEAAARLLENRASNVVEADQTGRDNVAAWPEFAEYGCFACHHELRSKSRLTASTRQSSPRGHRKLGTLSWGTWNFSELKLIAESGLIAEVNPQFVEQIDRLTTLMEEPIPDTAQVGKLAGEIASQLKRATDTIERDFNSRSGSRDALFEPAAIAKLMALAADNSFEPPDWDQSAQRFLTVQALVKARKLSLASANQPLSAKSKAIDAAVEDLRRGLSFQPETSAATVGETNSAAPVRRFDSPRAFDPTLNRKKIFQPLFDLISPRSPQETKP